MTIPRYITRLLSRISTFGPAPRGGVIPADARPISERDDNVEPDMAPTTQGALAGDGSRKGDVAEGSEDDSSPGGDTNDDAKDGQEPTDGGDDGASSAEPSPDGGTAERAQEADDGAAQAAAQAVRAATDALLASPDTETPTKMRASFKPTITPKMMKEYEAKVEAGQEADGLSELIGAAISEVIDAYDEKRVLPVEMTVSEAKRIANNNERIAVWAQANKKDAENPDLWSKMKAIYDDRAFKYGKARADRITMEQLAIMAKGELPASKRNAKAPAKGSEAEAQKKAALGATKTPGTLGVIRPKAQAPAKGKVGHDGEAYRRHLQSASRDLW